MPYITKISAQKNNEERVNIFLDEKYAFSVDLDVLVKFDLRKGKELDELDIIEIQFNIGNTTTRASRTDRTESKSAKDA